MTNKEEMITKAKLAAYALNMCTVSISQIIDYNDINILKQEYEAILNNLNLETIPKDDALLHILRQLLDTITYFIIADGDEQIIEKEYQQKMKNAIWSAVPNFGLLVAGGSWSTMAISLASQVGIGYMNYRRNKAEYATEKERQLWQLRRTAIEQFNALKRELFDTAWRLADTYKFPDEYRITEKQIKQYNHILMDRDSIRKYERLESIKDKFEAYPPFWYFIGNTANFIAGDKNLKISNEVRNDYRKCAKRYFEKYESFNELNILREDMIAASCKIEYAELLLNEKNPDKSRIAELLNTAIKMSGNANDIMELCAITYLKIGQQSYAEKYLKILVNEEYNSIINAQLLSSIYVYNANKVGYEILTTRVDSRYLYPMPKEDTLDLKQLEDEFVNKQKEILKRKYAITVDRLIEKYAIEWNKITSVFDLDENYPKEFFYDIAEARTKRINQARMIFSDKRKEIAYQNRMKNANYEINIIRILNEFCNSMFRLTCKKDQQHQEFITGKIREELVKNKENVNLIHKKMLDGEFDIQEYEKSQKISLTNLVSPAIEILKSNIDKSIEYKKKEDFLNIESDLRLFCVEQGIKQPEIENLEANSMINLSNNKFNNLDFFSPALFGSQAIIAQKNMEFLLDIATFVKEKMQKISLQNGQAAIYYYNDDEFDAYLCDKMFTMGSGPDVKKYAIMIIKDLKNKNNDLVFTTKGIINPRNGKMKFITPYNEIELKNDAIILYPNYEYKNEALDILALSKIVREVGNRYICNFEKKTEYVDKLLDGKLIAQWFKEREDAWGDDIVRVCAIPDKNVLNQLGYRLDKEINPDKNLLQFYYNTQTKDIVDLRMIHFKDIDSNLQTNLIENNGILKIGR